MVFSNHHNNNNLSQLLTLYGVLKSPQQEQPSMAVNFTGILKPPNQE